MTYLDKLKRGHALIDLPGQAEEGLDLTDSPWQDKLESDFKLTYLDKLSWIEVRLKLTYLDKLRRGHTLTDLPGQAEEGSYFNWLTWTSWRGVIL